MLNKNFFLGTRTEYVDRDITIHEHRAPTDASIKILREMEEKLLEQLVFKGPFEANGFKGELHVFRMAASGENDVAVIFAFELNGKMRKVDVTFRPERRDSPWERMQKLGEAVRDAMAKDLATHLFNDVMSRFRDVETLTRALGG